VIHSNIITSNVPLIPCSTNAKKYWYKITAATEAFVCKTLINKGCAIVCNLTKIWLDLNKKTCYSKLNITIKNSNTVNHAPYNSISIQLSVTVAFKEINDCCYRSWNFRFCVSLLESCRLCD